MTGEAQMNERAIAELLPAVPIPMALVGRDHRIAAANDPALALLGEGVIGRHCAMAFRQPALLEAVEVGLDQAATSTARFTQTGPSHEVTHRVTVTPCTWGVLLAFQDITEIEQISQLRRDFVANVSHELRSPLTALLGFIETLQGPARDDAAARDRFLTIMSREAGRMTRIVRDLLSLSRVESEERLRPTGRVDLAGLVSSAAQTLRPLAASQGVELTVDGVCEPVYAAADPDQITQVFTNLIENALKYGASGKRVEVSLTRREGVPGFPCKVAAVSVKDWGEGIDEVHLPRLTERFYRVDSHRSREKGGTGLGLAIVKHIVHRHRGRLKIDSRKGEGSRFTVLVPLD